jgi:predicted Ser/Thr protein kinase
VEGLQPQDPRKLGDYILRYRLGEGGMGRVYLGQSRSGRLVVIKVIRRELADDHFRQRLEREFNAARHVGGVFIATVIAADTTGPVPWIASEYVPGPSLKDMVAERGPAPGTALAILAAGLAEGLTAIHDAGVAHRDLSSGNVLLADDGPRIIDFGIAAAAEETTLTQTGWVLGTPGYMSPEQAVNTRQAGQASDIFSLGAVLAFAATGRKLFHFTDPEDISDFARQPPELDGVPREFRDLLLWCLQRNPENRPSAHQVLDAVNARFPNPPDPTGWLRHWPPPGNEPDTVAVRRVAGNGGTTAGSRRRAGQHRRVTRPMGPTFPMIGYGRVRRAATAAAVIAAALVIGVTSALLANNSGSGNAAQAAVTYQRFQPGECLDGAGLPAALLSQIVASWTTPVSQVSCGTSHAAEVYYANNGFWQQQYPPPEDILYGEARTECRAALTQYVGISSNASEYSISVLLPTQGSWKTGDRSLQCLAFLATRTGTQPMTGSIKNSRR